MLIKSASAGKEGASPKGTYLLINENKFERHTPNHIYERIISVNKKTQPSQMDLHIINEPDKGKTFLGIFIIEGDTLTIAHSLPGKSRPVEFESTKENEQILSISVKEQLWK